MQNDHCLAFRDVAPKAPVHVLVIPRAHVESISEVSDPAIFTHVLQMVADVAEREGIEGSGYRTVFNTGSAGGQTVFHLHAHVLGGRDLGWPPG